MIQRLLIFGVFSFIVSCASDPKEPVIVPVESSPVPTPVVEKVQKSEFKVSPVTRIWSYEGDTGPEHWGDIKPEFSLCRTGKSQSPVDLKFHKPKGGGEISFNYRPEPLKVMDNGYTIEVGTSGQSSAKLHGQNFSLTHIQFRTSSEHTLSGNSLPMEAQFFHKSDNGEIAVVAIILIVGKENQTIRDIFDNFPKQKGMVVEKPNTLFDPSRLLPDHMTHYMYTGSLTTPPCTEGVRWYVLNTPVEMSKAQILQFRQVYSKNNRPLQPLNNRIPLNF